MNVVIGLALFLGNLHGNGAGGKGDGIGQGGLTIHTLQINGDLHNAGVHVLAAGEAALGYIHVGLHQFHREDEQPEDNAVDELYGVKKPG